MVLHPHALGVTPLSHGYACEVNIGVVGSMYGSLMQSGSLEATIQYEARPTTLLDFILRELLVTGPF